MSTIEGVVPNCSMGGISNGCLDLRPLNRDDTRPLGRMDEGHANYIENDGSFFTFSFALKPMWKDFIGNKPLEVYLERPEGTVRIDLDRFRIFLPSDDSFPDDTPSGCANLAFGNGSASENGYSPWPWKSSWSLNHMTVEEELGEDGMPNRFFRQLRGNNDWGIRYKTYPYKTPCLVANVEYELEVKMRVLSDLELTVDWRFGHITQAGKWTYHWLIVSFFLIATLSAQWLG